MNKKIEVASFLGDLAKFQSQLDERLSYSSKLIEMVEKHYDYFDEKDFNSFRHKIGEIVRDIKILRRSITLLSEKVQKLDLLEKIPAEISKDFMFIFETKEMYSRKWKEIYKDLSKKVSKTGD